MMINFLRTLGFELSEEAIDFIMTSIFKFFFLSSISHYKNVLPKHM